MTLKTLAVLLPLTLGCATAPATSSRDTLPPLSVSESGEEVVECDDPEHGAMVWCKGAAWTRCANTPCPTRCSEGHIVRCSCCAGQL